MIKDYIALDLETTGLDSKRDRITEIGMAKVRGGNVIDTYKSFVNPGRQLSARITELTGITDEDVAGAPFIEDIIPDILEFAGEDILLGHAILFDYSFLKRAIINNGGTFEREGIDTLNISRIYLSDLPSRNLNKLCQFYNIEHQEHRALNDAIAAHELYLKLLENYYNENTPKAFASHRLIYKVKKEGPITKAQIEQLKAIIQLYQVEFPYDIERLTKNEASRFIDTIKASRGQNQDNE